MKQLLNFIFKANKISGPKRTVAITNHFTCISTNLIYCITCTLCKKKYTSAKRAADWVTVSANILEMSRSTIKTLPNQSCDISTFPTILKNPWRFVAFLGNTESRKKKNIEQKFIFQIGTLSPSGINERFSFL